jgi:amino acid permease
MNEENNESNDSTNNKDHNKSNEETTKDTKDDENEFLPKGDIDEDLIISEDKLEEEKFEEKSCSMKEGSLLGGIFALSSIALGPGAYSLPIRCTQLGLVWFIVFIIIAAFVTYWSMSGLIKAARKVRGEDYSPSVKALVGKPFAILIDVTIILYLIGVFIQYQVIIYSLIGRTIYEFFGDKKLYENFDIYEEKVWDSAILKYPIMFGIITLVMPLCLLKNISKMRFASLFGICAYIYCISVIVIQSPWFLKHYLDNYKKDDPSTHANWYNLGNGFTKELYFFTGIATVFFAYECHTGAFPVYKNLKNHTEERINKLYFRSLCLDIAVYILISVSGFITAPLNPKSLIIFRDNVVFKNDIFMIIAKIALACNLFLSLPANYAGYRQSFFIFFFGTDKIDNKRNLIVTISSLFISTLIGAVYKNILNYISFLGGFCCSIINFLVPGAMIIKGSGEKLSSPKNILTFIAFATLTTLGFLGGIQTIRASIMSSK